MEHHIKKSNLIIRRHIQKLNVPKSQSSKVDSPIAKYDSAGNLTCIMCRVPVKSSNLWKVHVNSKQHKRSLDLAKQINLQKSQNLSDELPSSNPKLRSILEQVEMVKEDSLALRQLVNAPVTPIPSDVLPEKFFDIEKSNNTSTVENKDDEEWIRFQREIKAAASVSNIIIADEQENISIKRQLKEIDEQMENWNRFIRINLKKDKLLQTQKSKKFLQTVEGSSSSEGDGSDTDLSNWRTKSLKKK